MSKEYARNSPSGLDGSPLARTGRSIEVRTEVEQIEVTSCPALLGFNAPMDVARRFIPGRMTVYVTVDGVDLEPMTPEEYLDWRGKWEASHPPTA